MVERVSEFDAVATQYEAQHAASIRLSGEDTDFFARYKVEMLHRFALQRMAFVRNIMDFGAGIGNAEVHLHKIFPETNITALDVSKKSLAICNARKLKNVTTLLYDGKDIPCKKNSYDIVYTACVFHHIDAREHLKVLSEINRVLKQGGIFVLFEHNPWNPLTRYAVDNCPFDENAVLISVPEMCKRLRKAGFQKVDRKYCLFFPSMLGFLRPLERYMAWLPFGAQYVLIGTK
jgi:ubiquinone/menaquinone biosynthesis C-methylase UbiE